MTTAIYARVSTKNQDTDNQVLELRAIAEKAGWEIGDVYIDHGISGAKGREERPALDNLLKDVTRRKVSRVMVWSVDRLGRSLQDLISTLNEIKDAGADLFIHQQALDTSIPAGKAMFSMLGVFAEFEREMIRERVRSGLEKAKQKGTKLGRKSTAPIIAKQIIQYRNEGLSQTDIARKVGVSQGTVSNILRKVA